MKKHLMLWGAGVVGGSLHTINKLSLNRLNLICPTNMQRAHQHSDCRDAAAPAHGTSDYLAWFTEINTSDSFLCPVVAVYLDWTADLLTKRQLQDSFLDGGALCLLKARCVKRLHACHKCFIISWTATASAALIIFWWIFDVGCAIKDSDESQWASADVIDTRGWAACVWFLTDA